MGNKVAPDVSWVVDEDTGVVRGQRLANGVVEEIMLTSAEAAAVAAAVAGGLATYSASEIDNRAGVPNITALQAAMAASNYQRAFTLYQRGALTGPVTQAAATWTSVTASDNGSGKLRLSSAGVHGLSTVGQSIYVTFATTGTGLHQIATVVNTTTLDFTTDFSAVSGAVTVYLVGTTSPLVPALCTVPGTFMGPNGSLDVDFVVKCTANASSKYLYLDFGATAPVSEAIMAGASDAVNQFRARICNQNSAASQVTSNLKTGGTNPLYASTEDTTAAKALALRYKVPTADHYITVSHVRVNVVPGL